jgi:Uri superfamily endonuclease
VAGSLAQLNVEIIGKLPVSVGSYALRLQLDQPTFIQVGQLGGFDFPSGEYFYLGSACGPGGLRARLRHHLLVSFRPHWHIDYLSSQAPITGIWMCEGPGSLECLWSQELVLLPGAQIAVPGFGASDCRQGCPAHLVTFPGGAPVTAIEAVLRGVLSAGLSLRYIDRAA